MNEELIKTIFLWLVFLPLAVLSGFADVFAKKIRRLFHVAWCNRMNRKIKRIKRELWKSRQILQEAHGLYLAMRVNDNEEKK